MIQKNWYIKKTYKNRKFKFVIDYSYYNDSLYEIDFKGKSLNPGEITKHDIKMALFNHFQIELNGCKKLKHEGELYHDILKYDGSIQYGLSGNSLYITGLSIHKRIIDSIDPNLMRNTIDALSIINANQQSAN